MSADDPRIAPLPTEEWGEEHVAVVRASFGDQAVEHLLASGPDAPSMPNVLATLVRHPALAGPFLTYNQVLLSAPSVTPRHRELMILRVAWRTRSAYEWAQHVRLAPRCDITPADLDAIVEGAEAGVWSPLETDLLRATDELLDHYRIEDDTWARLAEHLDERQLIEIAFIVGTYTGLAMAFNSFGIELDPDLNETVLPPLPESDG